MTLRNKTALITGASGGLGKAIAQAFQDSGCKVIATGRNEGKLKKIGCNYITADLINPGSLLGKIDEPIDILVNCAGLFFVKSLGQTSAQDFGKCLSINLISPYLLCKELIPHMITRGWGRVINIASSSAYAGAAKTTAYTASKHGLLGLSRSLNNELKGTGVRVLSVSPGSIQTEMGREVEKLGQDYETFLDPVEVADYIVYNAALNGEMISEEIRLNRINIQ